MATHFIHQGQQYMITTDGRYGYRVHKETQPGPRYGAPVYIEDTDAVRRAYAELQRELDDDFAAFMEEEQNALALEAEMLRQDIYWNYPGSL